MTAPLRTLVETAAEASHGVGLLDLEQALADIRAAVLREATEQQLRAELERRTGVVSEGGGR